MSAPSSSVFRFFLILIIRHVVQVPVDSGRIHDAFQMIQLMAEGPGQEFFPLYPDRVHILIEALYDHMIRALTFPALPGNGQAAFRAFLLSVLLDDLRIDQHDWALSHIDHNDPAQDTDLRSGQTDSLRVVHGLQHIIDQFPQPGSHFLHFPAFLGKNIITINPDLS